jgi:hypothetical protein
MTIHHVNVQQRGASTDSGIGVFGQAGEIG